MISTERLGKELKAVKEERERIGDIACRRSAYDVVLALLLESLSPQQRDVYDYVCRFEKARTSDLTERFGWEPNHAANLLKALFDLGLLRRRCDPVCTYRRADL